MYAWGGGLTDAPTLTDGGDSVPAFAFSAAATLGTALGTALDSPATDKRRVRHDGLLPFPRRLNVLCERRVRSFRILLVPSDSLQFCSLIGWLLISF